MKALWPVIFSGVLLTQWSGFLKTMSGHLSLRSDFKTQSLECSNHGDLLSSWLLFHNGGPIPKSIPSEISYEDMLLTYELKVEKEMETLP
jgi:hypothetical protein